MNVHSTEVIERDGKPETLETKSPIPFSRTRVGKLGGSILIYSCEIMFAISVARVFA